MDINKEIVLKAFKYAFKNLYEKDKYVIENNTHEQSISGRIAMYLREYFIDYEKVELRVDIEYNRDGSDPKLQNQKLQYDNKINPYIRPDILFHVRGSNKQNIIYCEIKKDDDCDKQKVRKQVEENRKYKFGVVISKISVGGSELLILENGSSDFEKYIFTPQNK